MLNYNKVGPGVIESWPPTTIGGTTVIKVIAGGVGFIKELTIGGDDCSIGGTDG